MKHHEGDSCRVLDSRHEKIRWPDLKPSSTALLLIDLQYGSADHRFGSCAKLMGTQPGQQIVKQYLSRIENTVIPAVQKMQKIFRKLNSEVIFIRIESLTLNGRDRSRQYAKLGIHFPPGSQETKILNPIKPESDEIILSKTSTSAFNSTNLNYILRNLGIKTLVIGGVISSGCVELNVRDASDLGFDVIVVEDACAAWTDDIHQDAMHRLSVSYGVVTSSEEVISRLLSTNDDNYC